MISTKSKNDQQHDLEDPQLSQFGISTEELEIVKNQSDWVLLATMYAGFIQSLKDSLQGRSESSFPANVQKILLKVNYDISLKDGLSEGHYDLEYGSIGSHNFLTTGGVGTKEIELQLLHFDSVLSSQEVFSELNKRCLRPAEPHELLALGASYPDLQLSYQIVTFGLVIKEKLNLHQAIYLNAITWQRRIILCDIAGQWRPTCRFAAVPHTCSTSL